MLGWIARGLRTGVVTTSYPRSPAPSAVRTVPTILASALRPEQCRILADVCPTTALTCRGGALILDYGPCISCGQCAAALPDVVSMTTDYELAAHGRDDLLTIFRFGESHV